MFPFPVVAPSVGLTITKTDSDFSSSALSTYSFYGMSFAGSSSSRRLVACVSFVDTSTTPVINSVTIGGVAAHEVITAVRTDGGNKWLSAQWVAYVPTGTSGPVIVQLSAAAVACGVTLYAIYESTSNTATASDNTLTSNALSASIDVSENGGIIASSIFRATDGSAGTTTWTNVTEAEDSAISTSNSQTSGYAVFSTAQTGLSVTSTLDEAAQNAAMVISAWV